MRFTTSFLITLLFHAAIVLLDKGSGLILLRIFKDAPKAKGGVDLLCNLPPILMAVANLGLAASLVYFTRRGEFTVREAGRTTSLVAMVWGTALSLLALIGILVWTAASPSFHRPSWLLLAPLLATTPFLLLISYRNSVQLVLNRIWGYNFVHLFPSLAFLPFFLLIYYVLTERDPFLAGVYAKFVPAVLLALGLIWVLRDAVPILPRLSVTFLKRALSFGWRANVNSALTILNHRVGLYYIGALFVVPVLLTPGEAKDKITQEVGFFSTAVTLAELIWHFPEAMRDLMFSRVAGLTPQQSREFTPIVCRNSLAICAVAALAIWLLHAPFLGLWLGSSWSIWRDAVTPALAWLMPGTVFFTVAKVLQADLAGRGLMNALLMLTVLVFVVMTGLSVLLIPAHGAVGAAVASTLAYAIGAAASVLVYARSTGVSVLELLVVRRADIVHYAPLLARLGLQPGRAKKGEA